MYKMITVDTSSVVTPDETTPPLPPAIEKMLRSPLKEVPDFSNSSESDKTSLFSNIFDVREVQQPRFAVPMQYSTPEDVAKKARVVASRQEPDGYPATGSARAPCEVCLASVKVRRLVWFVAAVWVLPSTSKTIEPHSQAQ